MENTFDLRKFLIENKLTKNSRILNENQSTYGTDPDRPYHVDADGPIEPGPELPEMTKIANNLKKIKVDAEAVVNKAKKGIEDFEKWDGIIARDIHINIPAVEQQIEVVEDALEKIEDYAGDGWTVDIEDVAREKSIPELQMMLKDLVEETDELNSVAFGQPLQEGDLNESWKQWALGALAGLSVLGGGTAQAATPNTVDTNQPGIEMTVQQTSADKAWETLKSDLKSTNPMLIVSKDFDTGAPFQSLGWGTASNKSTGEKGAISIVHDKGSNVINLNFFSRTNPEVFQQMVKNANEAGLKLTTKYSSNNHAEVTVPVAQAAKLLQFIKTSTPLLKGAANQEKTTVDKGSFGDLGNKTGQVKAGPATTQAGSVKVGGKTFTGR